MQNGSAEQVKSLGNALANGNNIPATDYKLTADKIKKLLPKGSAHQVTDNIMEIIYKMEDDTGLEQNYLEEQLLSNINIIKEMKVDMVDYIAAVKYCTLKQNMSNRKAWEITFPERLQAAEQKLKEREAQGRANSVNIDSHVSNYNKTQLVVKIDTQLAVAWNILYMPARAQALQSLINLGQGKAKPNPDGELMTVTPHVQFLANKEIVDVLKPPEEAKQEIDININQGSIIDEYEKAIAMMADAKMQQIEAGADMLATINAPVRATTPKEEVIDADVTDVFDSDIHDTDVYEKYGIVVRRK